MYIKIKDYSNIHPDINFKKWHKVERISYDSYINSYVIRAKDIDPLIKIKDVKDIAFFFPKILEMREKYVNRTRFHKNRKRS